MDATRYDWPREPSVLLFYSPFKPDLLRAVLDPLMASLAESPRPTWIVYGTGLPECLAVVREYALGHGLTLVAETPMRLGPFARARRRTALVLKTTGS